ncbi:MAG: translation initiation factor IF-2 subunit alpha [Candidatus Bathyarchaeota archaeon]|nr:translation initiation factor IF-2 subunit alpha [Candidatus Bathyarchaeota archaeon]MDH5494191.1 translation initiation factor IF-2 subunit alpha [Candidatus Bathyarchaeota archaeon]
MPSLQKPEWPERGELVLATVKKVTDYGAYVTLEEYDNKEGLLHRSEISTSWVRNIRNHVREGQKLVLKVLRVNPNKTHIDLSRKRVNKRERIDKIYTFKHERKAETFLRITAEKLGKPLKEIIEKAAIPMEETYGDVYTAFEEASRQGLEALTKISVPSDIAQTLAELAQERIRPPQVEIKGVLQLTSTRPDGVNIIKKALHAAQKTQTPDTAKIHIYTIAAPKYRLKVEAEDYKQAETILQKASETAIKIITKADGEGSFKREK